MAPADKAAMKQRVFEQAEAAHVRFISLQFTDIMGVVKNVHIPFHKFGDAVDHGHDVGELQADEPHMGRLCLFDHALLHRSFVRGCHKSCFLHVLVGTLS